MKIIDRIKTKPGYKIVAGLLIIFGLFYVVNKMNENEINNIKNNPNIIVECNIKGSGWVSIDKSKITDISGGTFIFKNGYSKSCRVENLKD